MVSGLSSVAGQADVLWVCAALSDADRAAAAAAPDGQLDARTEPAARVGGPDARHPGRARSTRAYNGVANSTLWFVHHMLYDTPNQPHFGARVPRATGTSSAPITRRSPTRWPRAAGAAGRRPVRAMVQDYHLSLVPRMLADRRPDVAIAHFSHTPWAPPDYFRMLPDDVGREVLDGILGADHAGFLASAGRTRSCDCCAGVLGAAGGPGGAARSATAATPTTRRRAPARRRRRRTARPGRAPPDVQAHVDGAGRGTRGDRQLIVRVDRTELSKNIVRGLAAYRELLVTHPEWRGQVTHLAFAYPSRHDLPEYRDYTARVQRLAGGDRATSSAPTTGTR